MTQTGMPTLGRYTLVREIARSNDIVWEGIDPKMNRRVAVKELNLPYETIGQGRRDRIERFFREARAAGGMNHPNIVTIFEVGEDRGRHFIAMEYLQGQTLRERLNVAGVFSVREAATIAGALGDALAYAHAKGVIHRDIKPENIFVLSDGRVKLTDFGIARITHETQLTVAGQVFGTPSYMSPEQVLGQEIDHRSDIFSLGVLLYEMITGHRPFTRDGDSVVTITYRIMNEPTPAAVGVTPYLNSIIQRATAKNPRDRFQSAADFCAALAGADQTGQMPAPQPTGATSMAYQQTVAYGQQTQVAVAPVFASSGLPGAVPTLVQSPPSTMPSTLPVAPPVRAGASEQARIGAAVAFVAALCLIAGLGWFWGTRAFSNFTTEAHAADYAANYGKAAKLYSDGQWEQAVVQFRQIRTTALSNPALVQSATQGELYSYRKLGQQAQANGDFVKAQQWFQEAVTLDPNDAQARTELDAVQKRLLATNAPTLDGMKPKTNGVPPPASLPDAPQQNAGSTRDFVDANSQKAMQALQLLQQGEEAYRKGDTEGAKRLWLDTTMTGPGSPAALKALDYVTKLQQGKNPFEADGQ